MPNLAAHLFRQAAERGEKTALHFEGQRFSFGDLADRVRRAAGGLAAAGVKRGSHVGLMMTAGPDFIIFQQAVFALGAVFCPLNIFYRPNEVLHAIESCDLEFLITEPDFLERLPRDGAKTLRAVMHTGITANKDPRLVPADSLLAGARPITDLTDLPSSATGLMLSTSATTGKAKGVMLPLSAIAANYDRTPGWLGLDSDTVILCALPLYNTFGLNQCINALMVTGATMVLMPRFDPAPCIQTIERHRCSFFPAVPTMLQKLFDHPLAAHHDLSSIKRIMTGGAPVPASLLERVKALIGQDTVVLTGYGLTEATALLTLEAVELGADGRVLRPKSIGRVLPGIDFRVLKEGGEIASAYEIGEFQTRGPQVMAGYYKRPDDTAAAIVDNWLHTGDLGYFDDAGYGFIVDRKKDIIIRGGQNIYPADIEEVLYQTPGVREAAVIGVPDDVLGEAPVAFVAVQDGVNLSADDLIARCKRELAPYKIPVAVHFLAELPKGPTGKILKRDLRTAVPPAAGAAAQ